MYIHPFKESFHKALDFVIEDTRSFIVFSLLFYFSMILFIPSVIFGGPAATESFLVNVIFRLFSMLFLSWLTVALWLYLWRGKKSDENECLHVKDLKKTFSNAIWDTPSYFIFILIYTLILLLALFLFFFPVLYFGPVFYFLPYVAVLGLNREGEGTLTATRRFAKGHYSSLLFFFVTYMFIQFYVFVIEGMAVNSYSPFITHIALISLVVLAVFFEAWSLIFLNLRHNKS